MKTTIYINGRFLTQPLTGVQRYAICLLGALDLMLPDEIEMICLVPREPITPPGWKKIRLKTVGMFKGNLWEQVDLFFAARGQLLFSPANIGPFAYANQIATLHDASIYAVPAAYSWSFRFKYRFVFEQLAHRAKNLLTVSNFSKRELARYLGTPPERFTVIHNGSEHIESIQPDATVLSTHKLTPGEYFLMVGSQSAHKNMAAVLAAWQQLQQPIPLVVAGGNFKNVFQATTDTPLPENIKKIGYITDQELKALYQHARGFIFPSIYEGFGLPILEAMRCGCPVICSNQASMPEVAGDAALYFDPHRPDSICQSIQDFIASPELQTSLRKRGLLQAEKFTWQQAAAETLKILTGTWLR